MKNIKIPSDGCADCKITRHIRDEAIQKLDAAFDEQSAAAKTVKKTAPAESCYCTPTASGQSCC